VVPVLLLLSLSFTSFPNKDLRPLRLAALRSFLIRLSIPFSLGLTRSSIDLRVTSFSHRIRTCFLEPGMVFSFFEGPRESSNFLKPDGWEGGSSTCQDFFRERGSLAPLSIFHYVFPRGDIRIASSSSGPSLQRPIAKIGLPFVLIPGLRKGFTRVFAERWQSTRIPETDQGTAVWHLLLMSEIWLF